MKKLSLAWKVKFRFGCFCCSGFSHWKPYNVRPDLTAFLYYFSLRYVDLKMWSDISENLKSLSHHSFGKQKLTSSYLDKIPVDFRFICLPRFCKIVLMLLFFLIFYTFTVRNPLRRHAFHTLFVVVLFTYFIWPWFDALSCVYFTRCETSLNTKLYVLATEVAGNVIYMVFRQPFVI